LGVRGVTIWGVNLAGIAFGTMLAIVLHAVLSIGVRPPGSARAGFR
jgi:hypothetical protein